MDGNLKPGDAVPRVALVYDTIKIYFGDVLHLAIQRSNLRGIQSWVNGSANYSIEYTLADSAPVLTEYDDFERFKSILKQLDATVLFRTT